jgi:hypothetical protein
MRHLNIDDIARIQMHLDTAEYSLNEFDAGMAMNEGTYSRGMRAIQAVKAIVGRPSTGRLRRGIIDLELEAKKRSQAKFEQILASNKRKNASRYKPPTATARMPKPKPRKFA